VGRFASRQLYSQIGKAIRDYGLIQDGDHIMLGISGGKDSLAMAHIMAELRSRAPVEFTLVAVTIDPGEPSGFSDEDIAAMETFFRDLGVPYHVERTGIARILQVHPTKDTLCSLCANLRRGALYKTARAIGAGKVALGHHLDDAIETLFLNMFYQGSLRCFKPKTMLTRTGVECIRPLVYVAENEIARYASRLDFPVISPKCSLSGRTHRQSMKELVTSLSQTIPGFRNQMRGALKDLWLPEQKV
jgi:tRNA 2-thiocytidine biosynthesis protein TtcA